MEFKVEEPKHLDEVMKETLIITEERDIVNSYITSPNTEFLQTFPNTLQ